MNTGREEKQLRQLKPCPGRFETREEDGNLIIEGYFAVFDSVYEMGPGMSESIAPGAFTSSMGGDVRALVNHDSTLVIGRTTAGTLELREDASGLWGRIVVNPKDTDATNAYARVQRRDVTQCSIGFEILREDTEIHEDGSVHWTIREVKLWEVSICTFPAYNETNVNARSKERAEIIERRREAWREKMKGVLRNGTESTDAQEAAGPEAESDDGTEDQI